MIRLDVWLILPSGESVKAGTLVAADPDDVRGGLHGQFRYAPEYLEHTQAFPLDPLHLPLSTEIINADRPKPGSMEFLKTVCRMTGAGDSWSAATSWAAMNSVFPSYCGYWVTRVWGP